MTTSVLVKDRVQPHIIPLVYLQSNNPSHTSDQYRYCWNHVCLDLFCTSSTRGTLVRVKYVGKEIFHDFTKLFPQKYEFSVF